MLCKSFLIHILPIRLLPWIRNIDELIRSGYNDDVLKNCIRVTIGSAKQMELFVKKFKEAFYSLEEKT